jgi:glycosidase
MPDLNQGNNLLATYLIQNTIWWIEFSGIQGIRVDTYPYSDPTFLKNWACRIMNEYPGFNMVGEEWSLNPAIVSYWQKDKQNRDGYESCIPGMMDFPLQDALVQGLIQDETWNSGIKTLYRMLANDFLYAHPENLVVFPDNHDMSRIFTQLGEDAGLFKLALTYILTTRGIPQLLYGTEIQMSNKGTTDHGKIRSDFPGGWNGDSINARDNVNLSDDQLAAKAFIKKILNWRKISGVIHSGKLLHFVPEEEVYVYFRYDDNQKVMVVLGRNQRPVSLDLTRFSEILTDKKTGHDILSDIEIDLSENMIIPPKHVMIVELR